MICSSASCASMVLSVMTFGVWAIVWFLIVVGSIGGYRCTQCGAKV